MSISTQIKTMMSENKEEIKALQLAITSGVAALVYAEYVRTFKRQNVNPIKISIASLDAVANTSNTIIARISELIVDRMELECTTHPKLSKHPVFAMLNNLDALEILLNVKIMDTVVENIIKVMIGKFNLNDEKNKVFEIDNEITLFDSNPSPFENGITDDHIQFVLDQIMLQLKTTGSDYIENAQVIENNDNIVFPDATGTDCIMITGDNLITPIYLDKMSINNSTIDLIKLLTSTTIINVDDKRYMISTSPFNTAVAYKFLS